jgi:hypothetical protein
LRGETLAPLPRRVLRYSNRVRLGVDDVQRTEIALKGIVGKRLTDRTTSGGETSEARESRVFLGDSSAARSAGAATIRAS